MDTKNENDFRVVGTVMRIEDAYVLEKYNEKFIRLWLSVPRLSPTDDHVPVVISEKIIFDEIKEGSYVKITGQIRTRSFQDETGNSRLGISGYAQDLQVLTELPDPSSEDVNSVILTGFISKEPRYRETVSSGRAITDLIVAIPRRSGKYYDSVPCIAWGRNAKFASRLKVDDFIRLKGRFQSRTFIKKDTSEEREVYEISIVELSKEEESHDETSDS